MYSRCAHADAFQSEEVRPSSVVTGVDRDPTLVAAFGKYRISRIRVGAVGIRERVDVRPYSASRSRLHWSISDQIARRSTSEYRVEHRVCLEVEDVAVSSTSSGTARCVRGIPWSR